MILLTGCQNSDSKEFDESAFFTNVKEGISTIEEIKFNSSIKTNIEFSERLQTGIKVLNIQLIYESEDVYTLDCQNMIINLKQTIDLETLRKNYELIHISFIFSKSEDTVVYEYLNMTNSFAEGDSTLTNLIIEK